MTAEILRHSEAIGYDAFVVPAMLLEAWVAERRNEPGAAKDAYRRALELAGRIGFADHVFFALVRLGSNALARGDTRQAEELCRRALAMAEAASTSRLAAHARVQLARVLEAAGDADTAETLYRHGVKWSQTPRPRRVGELLLVVLAGSPGAAARGGTTTRPTTCRPTPPRWQRATAPRPTRHKGGCDDLTDAEAAAARGRGRGRRDREPRRRSPASLRGGRGPATGRMLGLPWQCQPGHGSRMAAAPVSVAGKQRRAERAGGDVW
jgi:hypothetical protein